MNKHHHRIYWSSTRVTEISFWSFNEYPLSSNLKSTLLMKIIALRHTFYSKKFLIPKNDQRHIKKCCIITTRFSTNFLSTRKQVQNIFLFINIKRTFLNFKERENLIDLVKTVILTFIKQFSQEITEIFIKSKRWNQNI